MKTKSLNSQFQPSAALFALIAGSSYGVGGALSQIVKSQGFAIPIIVVAQFEASLIILGILIVVRFRPQMDIKTIWKLVAVGAISTISSYAYYLAIDILSVGQAVAFQFQYVWIAIVIQSIMEHKRPSIWVVISSVLIIIGTIFGSGLADEFLAGDVLMDPMGITLALLCAIFYALFIYLNGKVACEHPPVTRTFFMVAGGLAVSLIALPLMGAEQCNLASLVPWGVLMGLVMSVIPCICIAASAARLPSGIVAILTSSELPMAVFAGCLILGETATPLTIFGVCIICGSIVLSELSGILIKRSQKKEPSEKIALV